VCAERRRSWLQFRSIGEPDPWFEHKDASVDVAVHAISTILDPFGRFDIMPCPQHH
jgi:hypothetical protein